MHPLEKATQKMIRQQNLLQPGETVVAGVSAGPDSMALLHVLARLAGEGGYRIVAVYVDHGLRPGEAEEEAALVRGQAAGLGLDFLAGKVDVRRHAAARGLSIEHAARDLRYAEFAKAAAQFGAGKIAVAHTADDQAEEVLLRLLRGTGRQGLAGMAASRAGGVVRPFLQVTKAMLLDYLAERKIPYLTDSSNLERGFLRNRVRLDLLPYLAERFNPNIRQGLCRTAAILEDEERLLAAMADAACCGILESPAAGEEGGPETGPALAVRLDPFRREPLAIKRRVLEAAILQMDNAPSFEKIEQLLRLADQGRDGGRVHLAMGLRAVRERERLLFFYPRGRVARRGDLFEEKEKSFAVTIPGPGAYPVSRIGKTVHVACLDAAPPAAEQKRPGVDYLDLAKASFPLTVRSPRPGDRFHPLGAPGAKKLGDFFTDAKVLRAERWQEPVLVCGARVLAVLGRRIDHGARITAATEKVLRVTVEPSL